MSMINQRTAHVLRAWRDAYGFPSKYYAIDTETSGLKPDAAILHLGWCLVENGKTVRSNSVVIDWPSALDQITMTKLSADIDRTRQAMVARGNDYRWTADELTARGMEPKKAVEVFLNECGSLPLCAHHGWGFDYPLIGRLVKAHGGRDFDPLHTDLMDTCLMARAILSGSTPRPRETYHAFVRRMSEVRCGKHSLRDCVNMFNLAELGADPKHAHDAEYDSWLAGLLMEKFREIADTQAAPPERMIL